MQLNPFLLSNVRAPWKASKAVQSWGMIFGVSKGPR
jgi:hypothetical protein